MNKEKVLSLLGICMKARFLNIGAVAAESAIKSSKAKLLILSEDASDNTLKKIKNSCDFYGINLVIFGKKEELGKALGKEEITTIAVSDEGLSKKILEVLEKNGME